MFEVVGYKNVEYDRKKDGVHVCGAEVYLMTAIDSQPSRGVNGSETMVVWLNFTDGAIYRPNIGDRVKPCYNRFGRVEDLYQV